MDREQLHTMASKISDLQVTLDVFEGLYIGQETADQIVVPFPEIGKTISAALITELIIGCAAIFTDPPMSQRNENMSINNLRSKYQGFETDETKLIFEQIAEIVVRMNIKDYRNKYVGHFDLHKILGISTIERHISVNDLREVFTLSQEYLNKLGRESGLLLPTESMAYYSQIPYSRNIKVFLNRISSNA